MTFPFPFSPERAMGTVHRVDGSSIEVLLPHAASPVGASFGEQVALGSVGEFVVVDIDGLAIFGRLLEIYTPTKEHVSLGITNKRDDVRASGHVQLLSTLRLDGTWLPGVQRHPRIGDQVYSASTDVLDVVVGGVTRTRGPRKDVMIPLGTLAAGPPVPVALSAEKLFGRHLAVLGATGAGKSWTLTRLCEEIAAKKGRVLLLDATGEFHTLADLARHLAFGSVEAEPDGTTLVGLPHAEFGEADRNVFLRPSLGVQAPKLRAAIRSLRLAAILTKEDPLVNDAGLIPKKERPRKPFSVAEKKHAAKLEAQHAPFDLTLLPQQIALECVYETGNSNDDPPAYGRYLDRDVASCQPLISRVLDLLQTPVVRDVVIPPSDVPSMLKKLDEWYDDPDAPSILRVSLRNLTFSHNLREILVNTIGRRLLEQARTGRFVDQPLVAVVDEAHQFFGRSIGDEFASASLDAFDSIAKEGRKYALTVCMATQRPGDIPAGVLSQAGMMIVHRLADKRDQDRVEQASSELDQSATRFLPALVPGEALLVGADFPVPLPIRMNPPVHKPRSDGPDYSSWPGAEEDR